MVEYNIIDYERPTPHSTALILLNSNMYISFEYNHPSNCDNSMKFEKF